MSPLDELCAKLEFDNCGPLDQARLDALRLVMLKSRAWDTAVQCAQVAKHSPVDAMSLALSILETAVVVG